MREKGSFVGKFAETLIANFLENKGWKILKMRYKKRGGEVDIVSLSGETLIFVEVKYRRIFGDFEGIVDEAKLERMVKMAEKFTKQFDAKNIRFDVIFIDSRLEIWHIESVYEINSA